MVDSGLNVIYSFISPYKAERDMVRSLMSEGDFIEVFVNTPSKSARGATPRGSIPRGRKLRSRTSPASTRPMRYPSAPEIRLETVGHRPDELADQIAELLRSL